MGFYRNLKYVSVGSDSDIKTAYENNADTNAFTDAEKTKLSNIESGATADQTDAQIKTAYENNADTNAFTDTLLSKLNGIESSATADQSNAEIRAAVEAATDSNVFTDADHTKLNGIEASATADQSNAEIKTAYEANLDTNAFTDAEKTKLSGVATNANNYVLPTNLAGDDISIDTGPLTGATVISDLDLNVTTDTSGRVTDANATVATRNLTLANLGYTGATNANYITNNNQLTNGAGYTTNTGDITGVTAGTGLTGGATSGTATLNVDVGTTANKIVQLDGSAKLPAIDGSQLTNLAGGGISGWDSSSGNLIADVATSGIYLGVNTATASNLLNDYEEGTWDPEIQAESGTPSCTYNYRNGYYIKVGNVVHISADVHAATVSGGSFYQRVGNFPFATKSSTNALAIGHFAKWANLGGSHIPNHFHTIENRTFADVFQVGGAKVNINTFTNNSKFSFTATYLVD